METTSQQNNSYNRAKAQVERLKSFYTHLAIYLTFCTFFIFLNFKSGGFIWAIFPIAGWGLGVLGHAAATFDWNPFFGKDWEKQKIKEIMDKERQLF